MKNTLFRSGAHCLAVFGLGLLASAGAFAGGVEMANGTFGGAYAYGNNATGGNIYKLPDDPLSFNGSVSRSAYDARSSADIMSGALDISGTGSTRGAIVGGRSDLCRPSSSSMDTMGKALVLAVTEVLPYLLFENGKKEDAKNSRVVPVCNHRSVD